MLKDRAIILLAIGQTLGWAGLFYTFPALILRWERAFGWSKADLTGAITLALLISAVFSPLAGRVIDRGYGTQMMGGSAVLGGMGLLALAQVTTLWQFYGAWAVMGVAMAGCLYEPCFAILNRARGMNAKKGIISITLAAGFASTLCFPVMYAVSEAYGWESAVLFAAGLVIFVVAPLLWLGTHMLEAEGMEEVEAHAQEAATGTYDFLKGSVFWFLAIGFSLGAVLHGATLHHLLPILDGKGVSAEFAILIASLIGPMQVTGRIIIMMFERHLSLNAVVSGAFLFMCAAIVLLLISAGAPWLLVGFVLLFGGAYGTTSITRPLTTRAILGGKNIGSKSGALAMPYLIGSASAPYLGSLLWGAGGYDLMLSALVVSGLAGLVLYTAAYRASRRGAGTIGKPSAQPS
ncbi:MFS transporter [Pseudovibrio exalbescens]|uniref:MFS transporter n=1 Tax=Pseudovibrio exalbescens TaxID=197461 RepID=A0A1U7JD23_9HYPH|nr:MFS transporter [Pseudovibrio exalbescens]OKL42541.1 hypothetical protein A3843_17920 [Pseudovibrio exalbescens]